MNAPPELTQPSTIESPKLAQQSQQQKPESKQSEKLKQSDKLKSAVASEKKSKPWQKKFWTSKATSNKEKASVEQQQQKPHNSPAAKIDDDSDLQSKIIVKNVSFFQNCFY